MDAETTMPRLSMSVEKGNLYGILFGVPPTIAALFGYAAVWGKDGFRAALDQLSDAGWIPVTLGLVVLTVAHELTHGVAWIVASRSPWSALRFGVMWKMLTPYCHLRVPVSAGAYRVGALAPLVLLGLLPTTVALVTGWALPLPGALFMILGAGGDMLAVWLLRGVPGDTLVEDHPTEVGCRLAMPATGAPA